MNWYFLNGLKDLRKAKNINQKELGNYLKLSQNSISQYEMAERVPKIEVVDKLLKYFDVHIWELLGLTLEDFHLNCTLYKLQTSFTEMDTIIDDYMKLVDKDPIYQEYEKKQLERMRQNERDEQIEVISDLLQKKNSNLRPDENTVLKIIDSDELSDYLSFLYQKYNDK